MADDATAKTSTLHTANGKIQTGATGPAPVDAHPDDANRNRGGRFVPGNRAAVTHQLYVPDLAKEDEAKFLQSALQDEGDPPPVRRRAQLAYRAMLHTKILLLSNAFDAFGLFDRKGRLRTAWLQQLQSFIHTAGHIDRLLGLDRREKRALDADDPIAYLTRRARESAAAAETAPVTVNDVTDDP